MPDRLITFNEAKEYLKTSRASLYRFAVEGKIPAFKMIGQWRFRRTELDKWLNSQANTKPHNRKKKSYARS